jgi:hypothetical protein
MAWTAPRTWTTSEVVTASIMNTHVRDNLLESAPAKATTAGGFITTTGTNSLAQRLPENALVATNESTASTSYTNLATAGPQVSVITGSKALVAWACYMFNNTAGQSSYVGITLSGDDTLAATDSLAISYESGAANDSARFGRAEIYTGLTAGGTTAFRHSYRVTGGTSNFIDRRISVIPF